SIPSRSQKSPSSVTASTDACTRRSASSSPRRLASVAAFGHHESAKPPFLPDGPPPQMSASTITTSALGSSSRSRSAVQSPVYPPPTTQTSAWIESVSSEETTPDSAARASWSQRERWAIGPQPRCSRSATAEMMGRGKGGADFLVVGHPTRERGEGDELADEDVPVPVDPLEAPSREEERLSADERPLPL